MEQKPESISYRTRARASLQLLDLVETAQSEIEDEKILSAVDAAHEKLKVAKIQEESPKADADFQTAIKSLVEHQVISQEDLDELIRESRLEVGE